MRGSRFHAIAEGILRTATLWWRGRRGNLSLIRDLLSAYEGYLRGVAFV